MAARALATRLAGDLDAIVLKALRQEPQRRYIGAGTLADDLDRFLQGRPVAARPEGRRYLAGKFVRRHRVGIAVTVSLVLSLLGGLAATVWQARAKTLEAQKAEAVKAFLISIFQGADPVQAAGREITLRQVLDEGARRAQRDLGAQPAVQGELLTVEGRLIPRAQFGSQLVARCGRSGYPGIGATALDRQPKVPRRLSLRGVHRHEAMKRFRRVEPQRCAKVSEIE